MKVEFQELKQRSILLTDAQMKVLETEAERRGGRKANVSASSIIRELVDALAKRKAK